MLHISQRHKAMCKGWALMLNIDPTFVISHISLFEMADIMMIVSSDSITTAKCMMTPRSIHTLRTSLI